MGIKRCMTLHHDNAKTARSTPLTQWGAADAEIKVPSGEKTELKCSPFKAWSRSVYSHACYAYCQGFLLCSFLPCRSIHLQFFQNLSQFFPVLVVANTGSCVGPQNKMGHPAGCRFPCWVPAEYKLSWCFEPSQLQRITSGLEYKQVKKQTNITCGMVTCEMNNLEIEWSLCSAPM